MTPRRSDEPREDGHADGRRDRNALGYRPGDRVSPDRQDDLDGLIREGYVAKDGDIYELTAKGQKVLTDRGAGLNEA